MTKIAQMRITILLCFTVLSCSKKNENINYCNVGRPLFTLERNKVISFNLDSLTSPKLGYVKMVEVEDSLFFSFLNPYNNTVYCYEYMSKKLKRKIHLNYSKKLSGFEIISWNRILSYHYWSNYLAMHDGGGKIVNAISVPCQENGFCTLPGTFQPIFYNQQHIYLIGGMASTKNADKSSHVIARIDTSFTKVDYLYHFPDIYLTNFFGGSHYRMDISYAFNPDKNIYAFNFPASHEIFATNDLIVEQKYCAGSNFINSIPPYPYKNRKNRFKYCAENGYYLCLLYDKYERVYYRICLLPIDNKYNEEEPYDRDLSVIILDDNLSIIGEKRLKNNEDFFLGGISAIIVTPDGIAFRQKNTGIDESSMNFITYKLTKEM